MKVTDWVGENVVRNAKSEPLLYIPPDPRIGTLLGLPALSTTSPPRAMTGLDARSPTDAAVIPSTFCNIPDALALFPGAKESLLVLVAPPLVVPVKRARFRYLFAGMHARNVCWPVASLGPQVECMARAGMICRRSIFNPPKAYCTFWIFHGSRVPGIARTREAMDGWSGR